MVRGGVAARARNLARQAQGRESDTAEYGARMVQRFERTGQLATSSTQRLSANAERQAKRLKNGGGPLTMAELKEELDRQAAAGEPRRYVYACGACGKTCHWPRQAGSGPTPRCGECRRKARLATKRKTWHKHKEQYRARAHTVQQVSDVPRETAPAIETVASDQVDVVPRDPRIVWSPESSASGKEP